jgi:UDP-glucose 4-epimerase
MGKELHIERGPERKVNPVPRRLADTARAKALLGFEARVDLDEGMRQLVAWWRASRATSSAAAS